MNAHNDEEQKMLKQYLKQTLQQLEAVKRELTEKDRKYSQLFLEHEKQRKEFSQQNELLMDELEETRERYTNLKRQDLLFKSVRNFEEEQQKSRPLPEENSVMSIDDLKVDQRRQLEAKLRELELTLKKSQDKVADLQKQNTILSDYISLKESTHIEKIHKLQDDLKQRSDELERYRKDVGPTQRSRIRISIDREKDKLEPLDSLSPIKHIDSLNSSSNQQLLSLNEKIRLLERQKKQLEAKVGKCTDTVRDLEEYYTKQIDRLNDEISQLRNISTNDDLKSRTSSSSCNQLRSQLESLQDRLEVAVEQKQQAQKVPANVNQDLQDMQRNFEFALEQIHKKRENEISEGQFSQFMLVQTLEKKYDNYIQEMKEAYDEKLMEYENKLKFLTLKLEHSQQLVDQKNSSQKLSSRNLQQFLAESKIVPDRNELRMTVGSSFSSSIKESLARKSFKPEDLTRNILDRSNLSRNENKTPVKGAPRPFGSIFADRTNLM